MSYFEKKFLFKKIVEILVNMKLKNQVITRAKKIRNILEKILEYKGPPNPLSRFISISLNFLVDSGYLKLIKENSPKKYFIPDNFIKNSKNMKIFF